jgi:hypothetical protein
MRAISLSFALWLLTLAAQAAATAGERPPLTVTHEKSHMTCTVTGLAGSVTLEFARMKHTRTWPPRPIETRVDKLRQALLRPVTRTSLRDFQTGSWRIVETSFAPKAFFGPLTQQACSQGCAMHEATGIDVRSTLLVIAAATNANIRADLEFSRRRELYGAAPHAKLTSVGYGDWHGFVAGLPESGQSRASCHL